MNYSNMPLIKMLIEYAKKDYTIFHMPGHKQGESIPNEIKNLVLQMDLTELEETDNLFKPNGVIQEAQAKLASSYKAQKSYFLTNGSTCGVQAMIMAVCSLGDKIIVDRNCHSSVINGLILSGADPIYIYPEFIEQLNIWGGINANDVYRYLKLYPEVKAVLLTYPTYYGICSDIRKISEIVHAQRKLLLIDQAHGAHFAFSNMLPECAIRAGADLCVQSAHKTIPALTQSAYLHVGSNRINIHRLNESIKFFNSTSPSYLLMAFLDYAREYMDENGDILYNSLISKVIDIRNEINRKSRLYIPGKELINTNSIKDIDLTRLIINFNNLKINGYHAEGILKKEFKIRIEMADIYNIVCIIFSGHCQKELCNLKEALLNLDSDIGNENYYTKPKKMFLKELKPVLTPREVYMGNKVAVDINKSEGLICGDTVGMFPPGVPIILPGERITKKAIEYIKKLQKYGGTTTGIDEDKIQVVK